MRCQKSEVNVDKMMHMWLTGEGHTELLAELEQKIDPIAAELQANNVDTAWQYFENTLMEQAKKDFKQESMTKQKDEELQTLRKSRTIAKAKIFAEHISYQQEVAKTLSDQICRIAVPHPQFVDKMQFCRIADIHSLLLEWHMVAKMMSIDKKISRKKREIKADNRLRTEMELAHAEANHDNKQVWRKCRQLAGTGLGPKRRKYNSANKDEPTTSEWKSFCAQDGTQSGWKAICIGDSMIKEFDPLVAAQRVPRQLAQLEAYRRQLNPFNDVPIAMLPPPPPTREYPEDEWKAASDVKDSIEVLRKTKARKAVPRWKASPTSETYQATPRELLLLILAIVPGTIARTRTRPLLRGKPNRRMSIGRCVGSFADTEVIPHTGR